MLAIITNGQIENGMRVCPETRPKRNEEISGLRHREKS
jgi:hypothetical protein